MKKSVMILWLHPFLGTEIVKFEWEWSTPEERYDRCFGENEEKWNEKNEKNGKNEWEEWKECMSDRRIDIHFLSYHVEYELGEQYKLVSNQLHFIVYDTQTDDFFEIKPIWPDSQTMITSLKESRKSHHDKSWQDIPGILHSENDDECHLHYFVQPIIEIPHVFAHQIQELELANEVNEKFPLIVWWNIWHVRQYVCLECFTIQEKGQSIQEKIVDTIDDQAMSQLLTTHYMSDLATRRFQILSKQFFPFFRAYLQK